MHMADALISPPVGVAFWMISGGSIVYSAKKLKEEGDEQKIPLMGVLGAFVFAAQMINFTIPGTGSSGHLGGGMILAVLLGPYAGFITLASVLIIQALFFGDGGLLALGCNTFNMGFWTCFVAYPWFYRRIVKMDASTGRITVAAIISVLVAMQLGAFGVVVQTVLSGISEIPFKSFILLMQPIHLAIGLVEAVVTAGFIVFVRKAKPEILESGAASRPLTQVGIKRVVIGLGIAALFIGGILSWFASTHPDGLEWSIQRIYGKPELSGSTGGIVSILGAVQEKTSILPDYGYRSETLPPPDLGTIEGGRGESWPSVRSGTSVAGILGSMMTLGLTVLIGFFIRKKRKGASKA